MTTTQTFTAQDVADFAAILEPHIARAQVADSHLSPERRLLAVALLAREHEERRFADVLGSEGSPSGLHEKLVAALAGTYDEFRAEAGL